MDNSDTSSTTPLDMNLENTAHHLESGEPNPVAIALALQEHQDALKKKKKSKRASSECIDDAAAAATSN